MLNKNTRAIGWAFIVVTLLVPFTVAAETVSLKIAPPQLGIGTFFAGGNIVLSGSLPFDSDIIIEVIGPQENAKFNVKGRVGPFWMNRDKVELEKAPFLYVLLLPDVQKLGPQLPSIGVGLEHLKQIITIRPENLDRDTIFDQFVKLKRSEHLYAQGKDRIHYTPKNQKTKSFEATFHFPASTVPGEYRIATTILQYNQIMNRSVHPFRVQEVGAIKSIHELAYNKELIYGIMCVIIALFVGAVMGFFFGRSEAH
jgi:hypothetical protein